MERAGFRPHDPSRVRAVCLGVSIFRLHDDSIEPVSANVSKANLHDAYKQLRQRFSVIKQTWEDEAARRFEREVIDPIESKVLTAIKGMEHVAELMAQVRRDCSDD